MVSCVLRVYVASVLFFEKGAGSWISWMATGDNLAMLFWLVWLTVTTALVEC